MRQSVGMVYGFWGPNLGVHHIEGASSKALPIILTVGTES